MGFLIAEQYGAGAARFVATSGKEGVETVVLKSGERLIYNAASKEFAVVGRGGTVTYFKAGSRYWTSVLKRVKTQIVKVAAP